MMCYSFNLLNFEKGYYDNSIDITYVITLENSDRYNNITNQLQKFQPTKNIFICINKGYKNCNKLSYINTSALDLVDAYLNIFKHARSNGYKNVLIFEDDFIFADSILENKNITSINDFLTENNNSEYVYFLGNLPSMVLPYYKNTMLLLIGMGTHAVFYSEKCIDKILKENQIDIKDWDGYLRKFRRYIYNIPLCYQLFPVTENYQNWNDTLSTKVIKKVIKMNNLDKSPEPGYSNMYLFSKIFPYLIAGILLIFICYKLKNG